jgi:hypothetical protein
MKVRSSIGNIAWSLGYVFFIAMVIRVAGISQPIPVIAAVQKDGQKFIEEAFSINRQVRVTKIKVGPDIRKFKEPFDDSDDWIRKVSFEVESIAAKPIVFLTVNLNFPESTSSGSMMSYPIQLGIRPNVKTSNSPGTPLKLMPGEKLEIAVNGHYDELARFMESRHSMNQLHRVQVEIGFINFDDDTAWTAGSFLRLDPNNPLHYFNIGTTPPN